MTTQQIIRVLGSVRLSSMQNQNQTMDRQDAPVEAYANAPGRVLVELVEDANISGASNPFGFKVKNGKRIYDRPGLGPWLCEPNKINQWDSLVVSKLDRIARSTEHFGNLVIWCKNNGKRLVCLDVMGEENMDFTSGTGWLIGQIMAWLAQEERLATQTRIIDRKRDDREKGYWTGGSAPFGLVTICGCHKQQPPCDDPTYIDLRQDPRNTRIVREIYTRIMAGESLNSIARDLTQRAIGTGRDSKLTGDENTIWTSGKISKMFASPTYKGYIYLNLDRGSTDNYELIGDKKEWAILTDEEWLAVNNSLVAKSAGWGKGKTGTDRKDSSLLTTIAKCPCGIPYTRSNGGTPPNYIQYYRVSEDVRRQAEIDACPHHNSMIPMIEADARLDEWMAKNTFKIYKYEYEPDHREAQKAELDRKLDQLHTLRKSGKLSMQEYRSQQEPLMDALDAIEQEGPITPKLAWQPTNKTLAGEWRKWSIAEKREYLAERGFEITLFRLSDDIGFTDENGNVVKCDSCGANATQMNGVCEKGRFVKGETNPCMRLSGRRNAQAKRDRKNGKPVTNYYPNYRDFKLSVVPGWLFDAEFAAMDIEDQDNFNARMQKAYEAGEVNYDWTDEGLYKWSPENGNK